MKTHHLYCETCDLEFVGCIALDDPCLKIFHAPSHAYLTKSPEYFASAHYTHCLLLCDLKGLVDSPLLTVAVCVEQQMAGLPRWLQYSESIYERNLSRLKVNSLSSSISKLSLAKGKARSKDALVSILLAHFLQARSSLCGRSAAELVDEYSNIELPVGCARNALSLLSVHFESRYGSDVATALRNPPDPVYSFSDDVRVVHNHDPCIEWASLSKDKLVDRLHKLSMETLSESIQHLVPEGRPSVIGCSRRRTCSGLIQHLLERLRYLECAGADTLCNIYLTYFPMGVSMAEPDSYYVVKILEREYGQKIVDILARSPQAPPCKAVELKNARRKNKLESVIAAQQAMAQYEREWPTVVPQNVVFDCLNRYYEGSMWTEPPICAVCGQYQRNVKTYDLPHNGDLELDVLRLRDPFIIRQCVVQRLSSEFNYLSPALDGLMLDHRGVVCDEVDDAKLNICNDCSMDLFK